MRSIRRSLCLRRAAVALFKISRELSNGSAQSAAWCL